MEHLMNIAGPLLEWYGGHKRDLPWRETRAPYAVWISEIMLQQTRVAAAEPYYRRWMAELPDTAALAAASEERVMKLWQGLGYYSRARNLQKAARVIENELDGRFPDTYEGLLALPGVGEYTAAAVASISFGERRAAVDGNLLRIAARVGDIHENILDPKVKKRLSAALDAAVPAEEPGAFNQAMMDLGATVCLPNGAPLCDVCPIAHLCGGYRRGTAKELPIRAKKPKRRGEDMTVFVLLREGRAALRKREDTGLLAGLWEFPHVSGVLREDDVPKVLEQWGVSPTDWQKTLTARHIFTHVEWHMTGYVLSVTGYGGEDWRWVDREELETLAVPSAFRKFLDECLGAL